MIDVFKFFVFKEAPFKVDCLNTKNSIKLQEMLFAVDIPWADEMRNVRDHRYLVINFWNHETLLIYYTSELACSTINKEISINDLLFYEKEIIKSEEILRVWK